MTKEYVSPITLIQKEINSKIEDEVYGAVLRCDIAVDKEELIKALKYDRSQFISGYNAGYEDGRNDVLTKLKQLNFEKILEGMIGEEE